MEFMYQPTEFELQLSVLYVIKNLKTKATGPLLHSIIGSVAKTNFFEIGHVVSLLIESKNQAAKQSVKLQKTTTLIHFRFSIISK